LVIATSALAACTVVVAVAVLLAPFGSGSVRLTVAELVSVVPDVAVAETLPVIVSGTLAPGASVPSAQVNVVVPVHDGVALTNETSAGNVSVIVTFVAVDGPLFVTFRLYVRVPPGATGSGASVFVTPTSARGPTPVIDVALLFDGSGSVSTDDTVTVLLICPRCAGSTFTTSCTDGGVNGNAGMSANWHVTV
jgi:hypothetical protein